MTQELLRHMQTVAGDKSAGSRAYTDLSSVLAALNLSPISIAPGQTDIPAETVRKLKEAADAAPLALFLLLYGARSLPNPSARKSRLNIQGIQTVVRALRALPPIPPAGLDQAANAEED